jgi:hypothetical protein
MNMENKTAPSSPWKKPLIGGGIVGLVLICSLAAVISRTDISSASTEYEKNRTDAEKEGLYFTREQVEAKYAIPDSENGAKLIAPILPLLGKLKLEKNNGYSEALVMSHWAELEPAIAKIEEASHRPHLIFKRDFSNPAATMFPEYSFVKGWVVLFVRLGQFAIEKNDFEAAEKYWSLAAYLANKQDEEGFLIGTLVRIACAAIIEKELQKTISSRGKEPKIQDLLQSVLLKMDQPYDMKEPLKMENWFATTAVDLYLKDPSALTDMGFGNSMPNEVKYGRYLPGFRKANLSRIMRSYTDAVHLIPADPYDFAGVQRAYETLDKAAMKQGMSYTMQQIMMPVFSQTVVAASKEVSQRNALIQAVELLKTDADPAKGLPLKDRHAMDTDGKPIRLKKDASGWFIYSVGGDKTDNGGTPLNGTSKGDYVIRLPK